MSPKIFNQDYLNRYIDYLKSSQLSPASINRKLSSLTSFQKFLIKKNRLPQTSKPLPPLVTIPTPKPKFFQKLTSPLFNYLVGASLLIIASGIGYTLYRQAVDQAKTNFAYTTASTPVYADRFLSFQGRLTDTSGNPISSTTSIQFDLFDTEAPGTGNNLYSSSVGNSQVVTPDDNGIFSVTIGKTHGLEIPNSVFTENPAVFLQITAGGEVMSPRQPIATVAYAINAESLQGLPPSASGLKDTVLVIDHDGNLNLGETSPTIKSTSGTLGIEGQAVLIKATDGSGGNITINPDANGIIKLVTEGTGSTAVNGFIDATNANFAAGNLYSATINNTNRSYNFLDFRNYDIGTTHLSSRFTVDAWGNTFVGGTLTTTNFAIGSTALVTNLNADYLDGFHASEFLQIGQTGSLPYVNNATNSTLTRSGSGPYTLALNLDNGNIWTGWQRFSRAYQYPNGTPSSNLSSPSITEMALFEEQFSNKTAFYDINNIFVERSDDGINWTDAGATDTQKRRLVGGDGYSSLAIPYGTPYFRIRFRATSYAYLSTLYSYWSSSGHSSRVQIYKKHDNGPYTKHTSSNTSVSAWPGHLYLPFETIPFHPNGSLGTHFHEVSVVFIPNWNSSYPTRNIDIYKLQLWGGYPDTKRTLFAIDEFKNVTFPANLATPKNLSVGGTLSLPQGAQTGYILTSDASGNSYWAPNTGVGTTYAAGIGLTLSGYTFNALYDSTLQINGSNQLGLNLANANTWTGSQTFTANTYFPGNGIWNTSGNVGIGTTSPTQQLDMTGNIRLTNTTADNLNGIIYKNNTPFLHNFNYGNNGTVTTTGNNLFLGENAGNFTMGVGANFVYEASDNISIGFQSLYRNTTGFRNIAIGNHSLSYNTTGYNNSTLGYYSLHSNTTGIYNTALGNNAGRFLADGSTGNTSPDYSIYIGSNTRSLADNSQNEIVIGYGAIGNGSNSVTLGHNTITKTILKGNVGIGTTNPTKKLDVIGDGSFSTNLSVGGTLSLPQGAQTGYILTSDASGNSYWAPNTGIGTTYAAGIGLTLSGYTFNVLYDPTLQINGNNQLGLNLANNNTWTGSQTFTAGIGVSGNSTFINNLSIGGTLTATTFITTGDGSFNNLNVTNNANIGGTLTTQNLNIGSTALVTNLNAEYLGGLTANQFLQIGQTGSLPYVNDAYNSTLTRYGSGPYTLGLNLANENTWTGAQTFNGGVTASSLSVSGATNLNTLQLSGAFTSVGSTAVVINLNADYLDGKDSSQFLQIGSTGYFNTAVNGLSAFGVGNTAVGLGGTLIQNTVIDQNNYNLNFINGKIGLGTTNPAQQLDMTGNIKLVNTTAADPNGIIYKNNIPFLHNFNYGNNGNVTTTGNNLFLGENAGNFTMGVGASYAHEASNNIGIGYHSLFLNTTGYQNTALGNYSLYSNTTGYQNTALGYGSLTYNTTGGYNTALGQHSLYTNTTGNYNTTSGYRSLFSNTTGNSNTALGYYSLNSNVAGNNGVAIGYESQRYANDTTTTWTNTNTSVGYQSLRGSTTPADNTGNNNTAFGYQTLLNNTTGVQNTALGTYSLLSNTTGYSNTAIGNYSLYNNTTGNNNLASGNLSLFSNSTGNYNIALGTNAGRYLADNTDNASPDYSIYIGAATKSLADNSQNEIVIGYNAIGNGSNSVTLGHDTIIKTILKGNVGIGTTNPVKKLDVIGDGSFSTNLSVGGTLSLPQGAQTGYILTSDASGNSYWAPNSGVGTTYAAGVGLTLADHTFNVLYDPTLQINGSNQLGLNLGATNVWLAPQTFTAGIGVSGNSTFTNNLSVGGTLTAATFVTTGDASFNNLNVTNNANIGGTLTTQNFNIGSTALVTNLNAEYLGGLTANQFLQIGQTGSLPYVNDAYNSTLTRYGSGPYTLGLNLANENTWTGAQTFNGGVTASSLSVSGATNLNTLQLSGAFTSVGSTAVVINLNADYLDGKDSSQFLQIGSTGYFSVATNGLSAFGVGNTAVGLGGTLTQHTVIDQNNYNLNFINGKIGLGTTSPTQQLDMTGNIRLVNTTSTDPNGVIYKGNNRFLHNFNYGDNGTVTTLGRNLFLGENSGNFTMGVGASYAYQASDNIGIGYNSLTSNTIGHKNIAIGNQSLYFNTTGSNNTALGTSALTSNSTGQNNTAIGTNSLYSNTNGTDNTAIGNVSLRWNTTGSYNIALGASSLFSNTTGNYNIALGYTSLGSNTTGGNNTALGYYSLNSNVAGNNGVAIGYESQRYANDTTTSWVNFNTSIGHQSLRGSTTAANNTGTRNTALGYQAMLNNTTGNDNIALGYWSLYSNTTGDNNTALGNYSLRSNTTGSNNIALGRDSLYSNVAGNNGVAIGRYSQRYVNDTTTSWINYNTSVGHESLRGSTTAANNTGNYNSAFGHNALFSNTTGGYNTAVGYKSLSFNTTGNSNTALGSSSLYLNTTGDNNTALGNYSLRNNTTGFNNTTIGNTSLFSNTTGNYNIALGDSAGRYLADGSTGNTSPDYSVYIGYNTKSLIDNSQNEIVIGYNAIGNGSNSVTLGHDTIIKTILKGNVGIGTTNPTKKLDVIGDGSFSTNLSVGGTLSLPQGAVDGYVLTSDANGNSYWAEAATTGFSVATNGLQAIGTTAVGLGGTLIQHTVIDQNNFNLSFLNGKIGLGTTSPTQQLDMTGNIRLVNTTADNLNGIIYKDNTRFLHNFNYGNNGTTTTQGRNLFLGENAGNLTMGVGASYAHQASNNIGIGYYSLSNNTIGYYNTALGNQSLQNNTTGTENTAIGYLSLYANTTGSPNTAIGKGSLQSNTTGKYNTASGYHSLQSNTTGSQNTALGNASLSSNTTGSNNTALSYYSLLSNTTGSNNTALGNYSLYSNIAGNYGVAIGYGSQRYANDTTTSWTNFNTSVGYQSLRGSSTPTNNTGNFNSAFGYEALLNNTTGSNNTAIGHNSLYFNTTGSNNTALGSNSLYFNTTGNDNIALGYWSLRSNTTGGSNTALGNYSLRSNTTGSSNIALGRDSLRSNTTGNHNTALGNQSLQNNTTGTENTAIGYLSLYANTTGSPNTAIGKGSLQSNTTGKYNTASGYHSLQSNTTGSQNTALGNASLSSNTTGSNNTALSYYSLYSNTTGGSNTALGNYSLRSNTTGDSNTALGRDSLYFNTTGNNNTAIGNSSLYSSTTSHNNTALGNSSLRYNTTGGSNTALGNYSLFSNTTGSSNIASGFAPLYSNTTGNYNIALGDSAGRYLADGSTGNTSPDYSIYIGASTKSLVDDSQNEIVIGYAAIGNGSNSVTLGADTIIKTILKGNVGIGTTNPTKKLDVIGDGSFSTNLSVGGTLTLPQGAVDGYVLTSDASGNSYWAQASGSITAINGLQTIGTTAVGLGGTLVQDTNINLSSHHLSFLGLGNTQSLFLAANGNVGIGTTNPDQKLDVVGNIRTDNQFISTITTGTAPLSVSSTTLIDNLNADLLDGYHANQFLQIGGTGALPYVNNAYNNTLTRYGSGPYTLALNLTNPNTWTGAQTFDGGISASSLSVSGATNLSTLQLSDAFTSVGSTAVVINLNADYLDGKDSNQFLQVGGVNYFNTAVNGLSAFGVGNTAVGLGGTLIQHTVIDQNNYNLGFINGKIGLGTTNPAQQLDMTGNIRLVNTTADNLNGIIYKNNTPFLHNFNYGDNGTTTTIGSNLFLGENAGNFTMGIGASYAYQASNNIGIGSNSLRNNTTGYQNTALGNASLFSNTTGHNNTALGYNSLYSNIAGNYGVAIGYGSQRYAKDTTTSWTNFNTSVGYQSLRGSSTPTNNTGNFNSAFGYEALLNNTTGSNNTAIGLQTLLFNTTGTENTALGYKSLYSNTTGTKNTALGYSSLYNNTTGYSNTALGYNSLYSNTTGTENTSLGYYTLYSNTTGDFNIALGFSALYSNTTGTNNIALGTSAGRFLADGSTGNTSPDYSIYIGSDTRSLADNSQNEIVIGYSAIGNGSNSVTLGHDTIIKTILKGNVGIGTTNPTSPLSIKNFLNLDSVSNFPAEGSILEALWNSYIISDVWENRTLRMGVANDGYTKGEIEILNNNTASGTIFLKTSETNGAIPRLTVLGNGNVGIGTPSPENKLTVVGSSAYGILRVKSQADNGESAIALMSNDDSSGSISQWLIGKNIGGITNDSFSIYNGGGNRLVIDTSGNVGIGTATPRAKLDVAYGSNQQAIFGNIPAVIGQSSNEYPTFGYNIKFTDTVNSYQYLTSDTAYGIRMGNSGRMSFLVAGAGTAGNTIPFTEAMSITNTGNVGIGTPSPENKLTVYNGSYKLNFGGVSTSWAGDTRYPTIYSSTPDQWVMIMHPHIPYTENGVNGFTGSTPGSSLRMASNPATSTYWDVGPGNSGVGQDKFAIGRGGTPLLTVNNTGNVGIGIGGASPAAQLEVGGSTSLISNASGNINVQAGGSGGVYLAPGAGSWAAWSDIRLKNITGTLTHALDDIMTLTPIRYTWKNDSSNQPQVGLIAQEVDAILPEAISTNDGYLGVKYTDIIPLLTAGIQELNQKLTDISVTDTGSININYTNYPQSTDYFATKDQIETADYSLTDILGKISTNISQFAQVAAAKIKAGLVSTTNLIADTAAIRNLTSNQLKTNQLTSDEIISPLANIDHLTAQSIQSPNATIDNINSVNIQTNQLNADQVVSPDIHADNITAQNINLSGDLYTTGQIFSNEGSITDIMSQKISDLRLELQNLVAATSEATPSAILTASNDWSTDIADDSTTITGSLSLTDNLIVGAQLMVNGDAQFGNALVTGRFVVGETIIKDNLIETSNTALFIQPSGTGSVHLMGDTLIIADNGQVHINGDLTVTGSLFAHLLQAQEINTTKLTAQNIQSTAVTTQNLTSEELTSDKLTIATDSGSLIVASGVDTTLPADTAAVTSNATAGTSTLPANTTNLTISTNKLTPNSMVYLTPVGSTNNQVLYIKEKIVETDQLRSYFTIALDQPLDHDISINWWLIN